MAAQIVGHEVRELPVPLTDHEMRERGEKLAKLYQRIAADRDTEADRRRAVRAAMAELETEARKLGDIVAAGAEPRNVRCQQLADFEHNILRILREDTMVVVSEGALPPKLRQSMLIPDPAPPEAANREEEPSEEDEPESDDPELLREDYEQAAYEAAPLLDAIELNGGTITRAEWADVPASLADVRSEMLAAALEWGVVVERDDGGIEPWMPSPGPDVSQEAQPEAP